MFSFDDHGVVLSCPAGFAPVRIHHNVKKERLSASFSNEACANCDKRDDCPTQPAKKGRYLRYRYRDIRLLRRRAYEQTAEFHHEYRYRAGIEATNSELDRRTGIKKLRFRGLVKVGYCVKLKASGLNILRAAAYFRQKGGPKDLVTRYLRQNQALAAFKDQIYNYFCRLQLLINFRAGKAGTDFALAA